MSKKVIKKKKIKLLPVVIFLVTVIFLYFLVRMLLDYKIQNIYINGTKYLNDEYILSLAKIEDYPSFIKTFSVSVEKRLSKSPFIKKAVVKKKFLGVIDIEIEESNVLFYKDYDKRYVLDTKEEVDTLEYSYSPIRIINYVPDTIYASLVDKMLKIDENVRSKISQVKYDPSEYDDGRFLLYMIDGNYVYVTITKFDSLNHYNEIYGTLNNQKGTLYLDSGNYFEKFK